MSMSAILLLSLLLVLLPWGGHPARGDDPGVVLPMRDRAAVIDDLLRRRLDRIVPELMREHGIDLWIVIGREHDEDPVLRTMLPATWLSARRRTILVMHHAGGPGDAGDAAETAEVERLAVARYRVGDAFEAAWDPETQPDQWARLAEIIEERDPTRIGLNISPTFSHADGLAHSQYREFVAALPEHLRERLVSAEPLAVGWLERRLPEELDIYASVCRIAHEIMAEALSERVIQPGVTTSDDVKWWCRQRITDLGLAAWFHPLVSVQRSDAEQSLSEMISGSEQVIRRGDLVHLDLGITYLRLNTDTQQMAYVLRRGETEPPPGLQQAFRRGNRMQDLLTTALAEGRTGNEILHDALEAARAEDIEAMVYSHPIGYHGHGAGPAIGMWDKQDGVPGAGELPVRDRTAYSIELSITELVAEWGGRSVRIMLEEDAVLEGGRVRYLDGRQTELRLVR